jgi:hypothetical protein
MKTYDVYSRHGKKYKAFLVDENTINLDLNESSYLRVGGTGNGDDIGFIDPEGGPMITLFETASYCLHEDLPNREIIEIRYSPEAKMYTIKLSPSSKKNKSKSVKSTKIVNKKTLKHSRVR